MGDVTVTVAGFPSVTVPYTVADAAVVHAVPDFTQSGGNYGWYQAGGSLLGNGPAQTVYEIAPHSSTKKPPDPGVNPLNVICVGSLNSGVQPTGIEVGNFSIQGTPQGHMYGGLRVAASLNAYIHDLLVQGVPGDGAGPNSGNETFGIGMWHANGIHLKNVTIEGTNQQGEIVGATGLGFNFQTGFLVENAVVHNMIYGMGLTLWECTSGVIRGADFRNNRKPLNMEQCSTGKVDIYDMDVTGYTNNVPVTVNSQYGSTALTFYDPVWDATKGPFKIGWAANAYGGKQAQKTSDIHVIIGGKDVTADPKQVYIGGY